MSKSREQLNKLLSTINIEGKTVLDVGVQDKPSSLQTKGVASHYDTLDIDDQWNPRLIADLNDDWEVKEQRINPKKDQNVKEYIGIKLVKEIYNYDVIFCIEVLEHCWNPVQAIQNLSNLMREGSDLYISTPFINPHHDIVDFLRFTNEWYEEVLPRFGLQIEKITERVATVGLEHLKAFYSTEGMKYSKIRQVNGPYTYPIGYFIHAKKI